MNRLLYRIGGAAERRGGGVGKPRGAKYKFWLALLALIRSSGT